MPRIHKQPIPGDVAPGEDPFYDLPAFPTKLGDVMTQAEKDDLPSVVNLKRDAFADFAVYKMVEQHPPGSYTVTATPAIIARFDQEWKNANYRRHQLREQVMVDIARDYRKKHPAAKVDPTIAQHVADLLPGRGFKPLKASSVAQFLKGKNLGTRGKR